MMLRKYKRAIEQLPIKDSYEREDLVNDSFLYDKDGNIEIYWAPFDYINKDAKVFILGITPGWTQMELAFNYTRKNIKDPDEKHVLKEAKRVAGFGGSMRKNLLHMLDEIGLPKYLNIDCTEQLFGEHHHLLHINSVLRYPVFVNGKNYTGSNPSMLKKQVFLTMMDEMLLEELSILNDAVIIPTGKAVSDVLRHYVSEGKINHNRILFDFPHPSGANGHRVKQFEANKDKFIKQLFGV